MKRLVLLLLLLPTIALAEDFTVAYTEPATQGGNLRDTRIYWCVYPTGGSVCSNLKLAKKVVGGNLVDAIQVSDDGNGGDAFTGGSAITVRIPINEGDVGAGITVRICVTSTHVNGNEITRTTVCGTQPVT